MGSGRAVGERKLPVPGGSRALDITAPGERVEYVSTQGGIRWFYRMSFGALLPDGLVDGRVGLWSQESTTYQAGRRYVERWNDAPHTPVFSKIANFGSKLTRRGDVLGGWTPMFSDGAGHMASGFADGLTSLYREDGTLIGTTDELAGFGRFAVPPEEAGYRLEMSATSTISDLSTEVGIAWTFRSGHVDGDELAPLPVIAARFQPQLDSTNTAPAGRPFDIPLTVVSQDGVPAPTLSRLTVDVSYDDGRTWQPATVKKLGSRGFVATVRHPGGSGYVSLRASAADTAGNTVTQHVIRAYKFAKR